VIEQILVLLDKFLRSEIAILIKKIDFEYLLAIGCIGVSKNVCYQEGEDIAESSKADVG
jgi:hypothetical protein